VDDDGRTGPTHGFWGAADWLFCTDGKWRPVEPGSFPLAYGAPARVGRLRGYGNAINASAATAFIEAFEEVKAGVGE
jgi:DNA (cytosine-5)-methyltransferase 1